MSNITKPTDINKIWSSGGDIIAPSDTKISGGWDVEIPPRQYFNYIDNKQDQAIAHINQHGIAVWDSVTEYQAGASYVQGSNGNIYKSITTNTNIDPITDSGTNWTLIATLPKASTAQAQAWSNDSSLLTPNLLNLAFKGSNQNLVSSSGFQKLPGGLIIQWGLVTGISAGTAATVTLPVTFPNGLMFAGASLNRNTATADQYSIPFVVSTSQIKVSVSTGASSSTVYWQVIGF